MGVMIKIIRWLAEKAAAAGLILGLGLAASGVWLFLRDNVDFDEWRHDVMRTLTGERAKVQSALADVQRRLGQTSAGIAAEQDRIRQSDKIIAQLTQLDSTWDRLTGDAQQKANRERRTKLEQTRAETAAHVAALQTDFQRTTWERDGLEIALGKLDTQLRTIESKRSKVYHYLERVWNYRLGRFTVKVWVYLTLGLYFFGPTIGKLALYFALAPLIVRGRPVRLAESQPEMPGVGLSHVSVDITLLPGERLWVREKFLQASDEGLKRKMRFLLDWRMPLTWMASGLTELVEMRNRHLAREFVCTLSNRADPHSELAVVILRPGVTMVLRPSFIAGVILGAGQALKVRRRWQLLRWQAWVTLQFRFLEFHGPCRLVIAGSRGVRAEWLVNRAENPHPARRTNQDATIGFTPNLDYQPVRAETFWSYYRGMNPLFDDLFSGQGLFLCQQVSADGDARKARKFWSNVWGGALKVFGL
ncbi:MAG: hypothetical protein JWM88_2095 [Verrucomicrobia bacterium]|nr:hypothetical protein [Verrucomicrobiota bacterium]